jgi:small basic protein (TIGR04137 family)
MTMDKSLRVRAGMTRARSVLTRDERIKRLTDAERWKEGDSPYGLPKVRVYKLAMKKKKKKAKEDEEGADAAPAAAAGGKAAGGKAAGGKAPAGKAAAPAAKAPAAKGKK